jgi:hypothetical protein
MNRILLIALASIACGRSEVILPTELQLIGIRTCDGETVQFEPEIRVERETLPRLGLLVRVSGSLPVRDPFRVSYGIAHDPLAPLSSGSDIFETLERNFAGELAQGDEGSIPADRFGLIEVEMFSFPMLDAIAAAMREISESYFPIESLPILFSFEIDSDASSSKPTLQYINFCTACPDSC